MAKRDGRLMPQQMYEAVKKYETYVARNRGWMKRYKYPSWSTKGHRSALGVQASVP